MKAGLRAPENEKYIKAKIGTQESSVALLERKFTLCDRNKIDLNHYRAQGDEGGIGIWVFGAAKKKALFRAARRQKRVSCLLESA